MNNQSIHTKCKKKHPLYHSLQQAFLNVGRADLTSFLKQLFYASKSFRERKWHADDWWRVSPASVLFWTAVLRDFNYISQVLTTCMSRINTLQYTLLSILTLSQPTFPPYDFLCRIIYVGPCPPWAHSWCQQKRGGMRAHGTESGARHTSVRNGIMAAATVGCFNFGATKKLVGVDIFCFEMAS